MVSPAMRLVRDAPTASELEDALRGHGLELHYQPIMSLVDGALAGFEALIRWRHDRLGLLAPDAFLPLAEAHGLMSELDGWVLHEACQQLAVWQEEVLVGPGFRLAVNISGDGLDGDALLRQVTDAVTTTGADPAGLVVEVTETNAFRTIGEAEQSAHGLHALGVELAIDDFGTQNSWFSRLQSLPFDILKVDRQFVAEADTATGLALLRTMADLGNMLGTRIIAEGIETEEQVCAARSAGCHEGQGFYWSRAIPAEAAGHYLSSGHPERAADAELHPQQA